MIGTTVSHYKIIEKLGAGGMGEVFLALDTKLDRKVALKFLSAAIAADSEARERLIREAKATSRLNHPNILTIYSVEEFEGRHYIVMEYVPGETLAEHVKKHEPSIDEILGLAVPIAEGLSKAHQAGIVHRDMKPANVIIDEDGRPRILDFGLAKIEGAARLTQTGSTIGTVAYSSPELTQGKESDPRSDIFSFGVMLYEMVAGRLPFEGEHEAAVVYAIANDQPEPLARYKSDVSVGLQHIIEKSLQKSPAERYPSTADLLADLRHELRLSQAPSSHESRISPPDQKKSRTGLVLGISAAGVAALLLLVLKPWNIAIEPTREAQASRQMIAVLPFKNMGSAEDEYFADGITDEVITRLANISGLGVISRNSSMKYKNSEKSLQEIGEELGVQHILEGTIRYDHSVTPPHTRISPQLIRVSDDTHLWAQTYDRTLDQIFEVQSDIAEQVASELEVTLLAQERAAIDEVPTNDPIAYNYYLRSQYHFESGVTRENMAEAMRYIDLAVEEDPDFALAWAFKGFQHSWRFHLGWDLSDEPITESRKALDNALRLQPRLYRALEFEGSHYYHTSRDYERALQSLERAEQYNTTGMKSDLFAWIWRRQGRVRQAADLIKKHVEIDPRNASLAYELAHTLMLLRDFDGALPYVNTAISLAPDDGWAYHTRWRILIGLGMRMAEVRSTLEEVVDLNEIQSLLSLYQQARNDGNSEEALELIATHGPEFIEEQNYAMPSILLEAFALTDLDRTDDARAAFERSRVMIVDKLEERPEDSRLHSALGLALAGLGRPVEAVESALKGTHLNPISRDAMQGAYHLEVLAYMYALVRDQDNCIDILEQLMAMPSEMNANWLKVDVRWNPVREHPRFKALIEKGDMVL